MNYFKIKKCVGDDGLFGCERKWIIWWQNSENYTGWGYPVRCAECRRRKVRRIYNE